MKKIWLITGISSGLGKAIAHAVIARGEFVIGTFRSAEEAREFNNIYKEKATALTLDIARPDQIVKAYTFVKEQYGRIDVMVNNAGFGFTGAIEETDLEEAKEVFEANFFGTLKMTQTFLPLFRQQKSGHIIQISSHGGFKASAGFGIYNSSKFAVEGFSEALAQEIAPLGIKLTIAEPGPFRTNFAGSRLRETRKVIDDYAETAGAFRSKLKSVHGKQEGDPEKAAKAIIEIVNLETPPLRLPLGKVAIVSLETKLKSVKDDIEKYRDLAENCVF